MKTVLITGASSGIGMAIAKKLAPYYNLILCGRRIDRLDRLKTELQSKTKVCSLQFDVRDKKAVFAAIESLPNDFKAIDVLINNAGNAHGLAPFDEAELDDLEAMIDSNVKGLLYVTKAVLPKMIGQGCGHIVNISSIAGKEVYTNGAVYCASKWAVEALSKGMRLDLLKHNIKVSNVAPGAVETEFSLVRFKGDTSRSSSVYEGYEPLKAEDIAESIYFALSQPEYVQIADITVLPKSQANATTILRR